MNSALICVQLLLNNSLKQKILYETSILTCVDVSNVYPLKSYLLDINEITQHCISTFGNIKKIKSAKLLKQNFKELQQ